MTNSRPHSSLTPSFRDFSYYSYGPRPIPTVELRKPTILEVETVLNRSSSGEGMSRAIDSSNWPFRERMEFMGSVVPGILFHSLGGVAPFQADGIWGGYEWYYRERGGSVQLRLAPIGTFPLVGKSLWGFSDSVDNLQSSHGWLSRFLNCWQSLEREPFLYEFSCRKIELIAVDSTSEPREYRLSHFDEADTVKATGHTMEEAYAKTLVYEGSAFEYLGCARELHREAVELRATNPKALSEDNRVFGEKPDFSIDLAQLPRPEELGRYLQP